MVRLVFYSDHFGRKVKYEFKQKKKWRGGKTNEVPDEREREMKWVKSRTVVVGIKRKDPEIWHLINCAQILNSGVRREAQNGSHISSLGNKHWAPLAQ